MTKLGKLKFIFNKKFLNLKMWTLEFEILIKYDTFSCNSHPPSSLNYYVICFPFNYWVICIFMLQGILVISLWNIPWITWFTLEVLKCSTDYTMTTMSRKILTGFYRYGSERTSCGHTFLNTWLLNFFFPQGLHS